MTLDEELNLLEEWIRRLKIEYDIFFAGAAKKPPYDLRNRVEALSKRLLDIKKMSYAQRYRYNTLVAKYSSYRDLWRRMQQAKEEGLSPDELAEARLARWRLSGPSPPQGADAEYTTLPTDKGAASASYGREAASKKEPDYVEVRLSDLKEEVDKIRKLYDFLLQAQLKLGEKKTITYENFTSLIQAKADKLRETAGCQTVTFNISIDEGKIKFTAKVADTK